LKWPWRFSVAGADNFDMDKMMMRSPFNGALGAHTVRPKFT
jgi:hypothetical protein